MLVCWWQQVDWSFACLIAPTVTTTSNKIQNGDILAPANRGPRGKMAAKPKRDKVSVSAPLRRTRRPLLPSDRPPSSAPCAVSWPPPPSGSRRRRVGTSPGRSRSSDLACPRSQSPESAGGARPAQCRAPCTWRRSSEDADNRPSELDSFTRHRGVDDG